MSSSSSSSAMRALTLLLVVLLLSQALVIPALSRQLSEEKQESETAESTKSTTETKVGSSVLPATSSHFQSFLHLVCYHFSSLRAI